MASPLQKSLLRCAAGGISVFSAHTSLDVIKSGVNDWLVKAFDSVKDVSPIEQHVSEEPGVGTGRLVTLTDPLPLNALFPLIKKHLGLKHSTLRIPPSLFHCLNLRLVQVAEASEKPITKIAGQWLSF
jgi:putative NIF3 family GTP cyclohydrolase 1 type 2